MRNNLSHAPRQSQTGSTGWVCDVFVRGPGGLHATLGIAGRDAPLTERPSWPPSTLLGSVDIYDSASQMAAMRIIAA